MKRFLSLGLVLCLLTLSLPQKSQAGIGLLISSRTTRVVGGTMAIAGAATTGTSIILNAIFGNSYTLLGISALGAVGAILGLVVLDEKNANLEFKVISNEMAPKIGVSETELSIYNAEIEELNVVKEEIESKVSSDVSKKEIIARWSEYKDTLSPETLKVASHVSRHIFENKFKLIK